MPEAGDLERFDPAEKLDPAERFDPAYLVTLDELYHSGWAARKKYRIDLVDRAIRHFWPDGHPTRFVHIAGTNGKGSVAHYLEQGFAFAGATGSWTGPHVFDYAERFHLGAEKASHREIVDVYRRRLEPYQRRLGFKHRGAALSFAEQSILLAMHLFAERDVRWGMMEVGAGGRYTQLMAIPVAASIVTNVGYDHPVTLGPELWQRALTKAGIARSGVPFFTAARGEALGYVVKTAESEGAEVRVVGDGEIAEVRKVLSRPAADFELANLALAVRVVRHFHPERTVSELVAAMRRHLPGRFWSPDPRVVLDVAHNEEKVRSFAEQLELAHPGKRFRFLLGLTRQRDPVKVFRPLCDLADHITVTSASYAGRDPRELESLLEPVFAEVSSVADPREAYRRELEALAPDQMLVLTGSAYMIDQALNPDPYVRHTNASFGWRTRGPTDPAEASSSGGSPIP